MMALLLLVVLVSVVQGNRLPLAPELIPFDSEDGRQLLLECIDQGQHQISSLLEHFSTQETGTYCGVASCVTVLNAMNVTGPSMEGFPAEFQYFTQDNLLAIPQVKKVVSVDEVRKRGVTLQELGDILQAAGGNDVELEVVFASDDTVDAFQKRLLSSVFNGSPFMLLNYSRKVLKQETRGHVSVVGAFHEESDRVLILDVARFKYPPIWVLADQLFDSMNTTDPESGLSRGSLRIQKALPLILD